MASELNNMLLSGDTSILLQQLLGAQQQTVQANQSQPEALQETDIDAEVQILTENRTEVTRPSRHESHDDDFNEILINEIQSMPILWLRNCPDYKRADKKKIVWANIAKKLKCDVTYVKNRWKNLCDSYKKCMDRERDNNRSGSGATKTPRCRYYNQLSFLRDNLCNRSTHSNVTLPTANIRIPSPSTSSSSEVISRDDNAALNESLDDPEPQATIVPRKRKKSQEIDEVDQYLINAINDKKTEKVNEDSNDLFCKSITDILRNFPPKKNLAMKIKIQQLLLEEMEDD
ncbi:transcription factor Adf-1-like [Paramuricea clavata]|uniref:Transcription factor Adf-1-like n=1 Tax=Paramuricea clavata TaxID=317549 RepID=A0A7D9JRJ6_PARCT|nr:transcription factor Adf-1-like [Paramuricea clavata]